MARQAKEIARRLRFHLFPRPDRFRRLYWLAGLVFLAGAVAAWAGLGATLGARQYMPAPVSSSHATFGERCENCHVKFSSVPNTKCHGCHATRVHSEFEVASPACRECHVEHRKRGEFIDVGSTPCVHCHANLETKRSEAVVAAKISTFAEHPEFTILRRDQRDPGAVRFNHQIHFTSDKVLKDLIPNPLTAEKTTEGNLVSRDKFVCGDCHQPDAGGRYMKPIVFEEHCERCHEQKVREAPPPIGDVEVPHEDPDTIRDVVAAGLVKLAVERPSEIFLAPDIRLPGRVEREPVDDSATLRAYQRKWIEFFEQKLYAPFEDSKPLLERNKYCFLCHQEGTGEKKDGLPIIAKTNIPTRWLKRGEYDHRAHDKIKCETCHGVLNPPQPWGAKPGVENSEATSDVNLPARSLCQTCHIDGTSQSAGTKCTLCHLYHDTTKDPKLRRAPQTEQSLDTLMGGADVTFHQ
jgi:hypothetical protein